VAVSREGLATKRAVDWREAILCALNTVPSHREAPKTIGEIAGSLTCGNSSERLGLAGATVTFLDLFGVLAWEGERCGFKHQIPDYFRHSLAWYLSHGKPLLSNWDRPGTSKTITIDNLLDSAPYFLKALEQRRSDISQHEGLDMGFSRLQPVGVVAIKATIGAAAFFLHQWDKRAEQHQLIGGRQRPDEDQREAAARELREELEAPDLVLGRDYDLKILTSTAIKFAEVSRTYGAITQYDLWVYSAVFRSPLPPRPSDVTWISAAEMRAGTTLSGGRISKLSRLLDGNPKLLEAIEDSIDNLDELELTSRLNIKPSAQPVEGAVVRLAPAVRVSSDAPTSYTPTNERQPVSVFISYSHKDERLKSELDKHLSSLKREGLVRVWHDRMISPGSDRKRDISAELGSAQLILLLVTASFFASEF